MDRPGGARDLSALYAQRRKNRDTDIVMYDQVEAAIKGRLPQQYDGLFADNDIKLQIRTLRLADDGLTKFLSEIPVLPQVRAKGKRDSQRSRDAAEVVEKVAYGYMEGSAMRGGPEFDGISFQLARHQVRFGDGCLLAHPDMERKLVYLEVKDPRCLYTPDGWTPWSLTPLDGALLVYEMTLGEVKRHFAYDSYGDTIPDVMQRLNNAFKRTTGYGGDVAIDDAQKVNVGMYRSRDAWLVSALSDSDVVLAESQSGDRNHPGVCGVASFRQFSSEPLFLGQIGIEAGLMKVLNQQIQNTERINRAPIVGPPLLGDTLRWGEYNVVDMAQMNGRNFLPQRLAPDSPNNLTQVMGSLLGLAQMFNYNPESNQGQGPANSGKAIQQLQAGPRSLVTNILFSPYRNAFPRIFDDCMGMELNLWPNERKTAYGSKGKQTFEVDYTPVSALQGFTGCVKIEEARVGGYNAFLEATQKRDSGMASLRTVLEKDPDVRDVEGEIHRIDSESVEKYMSAAFESLGGQDPLLAMRAAAEVNKRIQTGMSKAEAIQEVLESGVLEPPPAPEMAPGGAQLPPELAAMMGGGAEMPQAPPSLAQIRGA